MAQKVVAVLTCFDWRLHQGSNEENLIADFCRSLEAKVFPLTPPGGVQQLVRPSNMGYREFLFYQLDIAVEHGAEEIFNINHLDCHAYPSFLKGEAELRRHLLDLQTARTIERQRYFGITAENFLAVPVDDTKERFVIKPAEEYMYLVKG